MIESIETLKKTRRFPGIEGGVDNLAAFVLDPFMRVVRHIADTQDHKMRRGDIPALVIELIGEIGAGKTYSIDIIKTEAENWKKRFSEVENIGIEYISWEKDGEDSGRKAGEILTPPGHHLSQPELEIADFYAQVSLQKAIRGSHLVLVEMPADCAARVADQSNIPDVFNSSDDITKHGSWVGRMLGSELTYDLVHKQGLFSNLNYDLYVGALIPGTLLHQILIEQRREIKSVDQSDISSIKKVALKWGMIEPNQIYTDEDLLKLQRLGASEEETNYVRRQRNQFLTTEILSGLLPLPQSLADLKSLKPIELIGRLNSDFEAEVLVKALSLNRFLTLDLGLDLNHYLIGYNNPRASDMRHLPVFQ